MSRQFCFAYPLTHFLLPVSTSEVYDSQTVTVLLVFHSIPS